MTSTGTSSTSIAAAPLAGDLISGTGGARKRRIEGKGKGKRGAYRVITYYAAQDVPVFLLALVSKGQRADISQADRNALRGGTLNHRGQLPRQRASKSEKDANMTTLGKRLIKAAQEASAIARGEANPSTYRVHVPASIDVKAVRHKLHMTQAEFSARFAVPLSTLKDWEQHRRTPEGPSRVLLTIIDRAPEAVERALAAA